jgi:hypothetical protein
MLQLHVRQRRTVITLQTLGAREGEMNISAWGCHNTSTLQESELNFDSYFLEYCCKRNKKKSLRNYENQNYDVSVPIEWKNLIFFNRKLHQF